MLLVNGVSAMSCFLRVMFWQIFLQRMFSVQVLFIAIFCGLPFSDAAFNIEFVKPRLSRDGFIEGEVVLYECGSETNTPKQSPTSSPTRKGLGNINLRRSLSISDGSISCKRAKGNEIETIRHTNNFFVVADPELSEDEQLLDENNKPVKLPKLVNVGVEFDSKFDSDSESFPKLKKPINDKRQREQVTRLNHLRILPTGASTICTDHLASFLSISDIKTFTEDSYEVFKQLQTFVAVLDSITQYYYREYYRTFWMYVYKYDYNAAALYRARSALIQALGIVLPKMIDPCFVLSHHQEERKNYADKFCTSYCKVLMVAASMFPHKDKICNTPWTAGQCLNNKCTCSRTRWFGNLMPRPVVHMHKCNNSVVQDNLSRIFRLLLNINYKDFTVQWVFPPKYIKRAACTYTPEK